ncbi:MAG: dihydropteroate synthase [Microcoleaceae cyanobacterium]
MTQPLTIRNQRFDWGSRTYLMGILNVTPDSFSDGGEFSTVEKAIAQAQRMVKAGVDIIDIGGQSTRPGAETIPIEEEIRRVVPMIEAIRQQPQPLSQVPISVDTTRASVAEAAISAGADWVNDISGAKFDPAMLSTVARLKVPIVLMHIRGTPQTMQTLTDYSDLMVDIAQFLKDRVVASQQAGIDRSNIILDPGIGFAKTYQHNITILQQLPQLRALGYPLLVGVSRKSFIGHLLNQPDPKQRVWGTAAASSAAIANGADILRVHDVKEMYDVCRVSDAIYR